MMQSRGLTDFWRCFMIMGKLLQFLGAKLLAIEQKHGLHCTYLGVNVPLLKSLSFQSEYLNSAPVRSFSSFSTLHINYERMSGPLHTNMWFYTLLQHEQLLHHVALLQLKMDSRTAIFHARNNKSLFMITKMFSPLGVSIGAAMNHENCCLEEAESRKFETSTTHELAYPQIDGGSTFK